MNNYKITIKETRNNSVGTFISSDFLYKDNNFNIEKLEEWSEIFCLNVEYAKPLC